MKFYEYINEDLTSKFFDAIKSNSKITFCQLKTIFYREFHIELKYEQNKENPFTGYYQNFNIVITIPDFPQNIVYEPISIYGEPFLGAVIHELGHYFHYKKNKLFFKKYKRPPGDADYDISQFYAALKFIDYSLQPIERASIIVSVSFDLIGQKINLDTFIQDFKKVRNFKEIEKFTKEQSNIWKRYGPNYTSSLLESILYVSVMSTKEQFREEGRFYFDKIKAQSKALIRSIYKHYPKIKKLYDSYKGPKR